jgi:hypothetical protein
VQISVTALDVLEANGISPLVQIPENARRQSRPGNSAPLDPSHSEPVDDGEKQTSRNFSLLLPGRLFEPDVTF